MTIQRGAPVLVVLLAISVSQPLAWYDPVLDYGIVDGHPEILWLKDHGDLTACCHVQGGVSNYQTICDNDVSGVAHRLFDYRFCTPADTMQGIVFDIVSLMASFSTSRTHFDLLDLYLMGLASPSEVPDHDYVDPLGQRTPVTIQSIIEASGVRDPAYPSAPQNCSVSFVVITPDNLEPIPVEMDRIAYWRASLPGWWDTATSGRSQVAIDIAPAVAGAVPDADLVPGTPLTIDRNGQGDLALSWGASCAGRDTDYAVYEGTLGAYYSHSPKLCSTGGATTAILGDDGLSHYYFVVPTSTLVEGSFGTASGGASRPQGVPSCLPQAIAFGCNP